MQQPRKATLHTRTRLEAAARRCELSASEPCLEIHSFPAKFRTNTGNSSPSFVALHVILVVVNVTCRF